MGSTDSIPKLVRELYAIVDELERLFPGRRFTPDGHLVGSVGEVLAAHRYGLTLLPASAECHDAVTKDGRRIQIKATQRRSVAIRGEPDHLIVLQLHRDGTSSEAYNGPGGPPWRNAGRMQKNGQRPISLAKLRALMDDVPGSERFPQINRG